MDREIPFDPKAKCDWCGAKGAFDFMGDFICPNCAATLFVPDDWKSIDNSSLKLDKKKQSGDRK